MSLFNKRTVENLFQLGQVDERNTQGRQAGMSPFDTRTVSPIEALFQFGQAVERKAEQAKAAPAPTHAPHTGFPIGDIGALFADQIGSKIKEPKDAPASGFSTADFRG